jgi:predicted metal-dependent HD superfamily phosphohydrolase
MTNLPLPDEQPITVSALRRMRAKIAGEIEMHSREVDRLRATLIHIDATLRLFDPETDPNDIRAMRRYPQRKEWFARGEVTQRIYEAYRKDSIIWPRQVARQAMADKGISEADSKIAQEIIATFAHVAAYLTRRGKLVKIGGGADARWTIAQTEPELF